MSNPAAREGEALAVLVTCEHGGCRIPRELGALFARADGVLTSHRGWDPGALDLARRLAALLDAPLRFSTVSRLVVDLNRSPRHPRVLSEFTRVLPHADRRALLARHHAPHRAAVDADVAAGLASAEAVLHVGVHTFTPVLDGRVRKADVALLYDPARTAERRLAAAWVEALRDGMPELAVRRNQPYRGASDGLTTWLRRRHGERYLGIEIEVNQRWLAPSGRLPDRVASGLAEAFPRLSLARA